MKNRLNYLLLLFRKQFWVFLSSYKQAECSVDSALERIKYIYGLHVKAGPLDSSLTTLKAHAHRSE
jgi:hypothetical protein